MLFNYFNSLSLIKRILENKWQNAYPIKTLALKECLNNPQKTQKNPHKTNNNIKNLYKINKQHTTTIYAEYLGGVIAQLCKFLPATRSA